MPSSQSTEVAEISSDSLVSEQNSVTKFSKTDVRRRRRRRRKATLNLPDGKSILLQSSVEKDDRQKEMRNFLPLPLHEKKNYSDRMKAEQRKELFRQLKEAEEEEQEKDKVKTLRQAKRKPTLRIQTPARHELKTALLKQTNIVRECKHDLISMERQKAVLEISLMTKRSEICKMNKAITKEERRLKELEEIIEKDNESFAAFLRENEKKSLDAQTFFEREAKSNEEKTAEIQKLTSEISTIRSEVGNYEEILQEYKRYRELLFQLSPPEWQEAQRAKLLNNVHLDKNPEEDSTFKQKQESNIAGAQPRQFSAESTRATKPYEADSDCTEIEDNPELYFTDPKQLIELMTELTEQNLSLIKNSTRAEETLEELTQSMEEVRKRTEKEKELLTGQIDDMNKQIEEEKTRASKLKKKVQLHVLLNTEDEDDMMRALGEKVSEVYRCCVGDGSSSSHSTLEKLASIEKQMSLLLHCLEDIPKASLETMQKIKESERRTRQREEKLRLQREKQIERMKRYMERSLSDTKKTNGRKLMPRCIPTAQKVTVKKVQGAPTDDGLNDYFFTPLDGIAMPDLTGKNTEHN